MDRSDCFTPTADGRLRIRDGKIAWPIGLAGFASPFVILTQRFVTDPYWVAFTEGFFGCLALVIVVAMVINEFRR